MATKRKVDKTIRRLDRYIGSQRQKIDKKRNKVKSIDSELFDIKERVAAEMASEIKQQTSSKAGAMAIEKIKDRFEKTQKQKRARRDKLAEQIEKHKSNLGEAENLLKELKQISGTLRRQQQKADSWVKAFRRLR